VSDNAKNSSRIGILFSLYVVLRVLLPFQDTVVCAQAPSLNWNVVLRTDTFLPVNDGTVHLDSGTNHYSVAANTAGAFSFQNLNPGPYSVTVIAAGKLYRSATQFSIPSSAVGVTLKLGRDGSIEMVSAEIGRLV
jgi:hypothetical protein